MTPLCDAKSLLRSTNEERNYGYAAEEGEDSDSEVTSAIVPNVSCRPALYLCPIANTRADILIGTFPSGVLAILYPRSPVSNTAGLTVGRSGAQVQRSTLQCWIDNRILHLDYV